MFGWVAGCVPENEKRWMIVESTTTAIVLAQWAIRYSEATLHEPIALPRFASQGLGPRRWAPCCRRVVVLALMKIMTMVPMTIVENLSMTIVENLHGIASRPRGRT